MNGTEPTAGESSPAFSGVMRAALVGVSLLILTVFGIAGVVALGLLDDDSTDVVGEAAGESGNTVGLPPQSTTGATPATVARETPRNTGIGLSPL